MAQDGVFKTDLETGGIALLYAEYLDGYGTQGDGFEQDDVRGPEQAVYTESPVVYGNGPVEFSTSTALVPIYPPTHVWDVEGYYATLGVSFRATRRELRTAFLDGMGHSSDRLTFIIKTLLRPILRREYDLLPLGARWIEDPWVQADIKRQAHLEAQRRLLNGQYATGDMVLNEWGFQSVDENAEDSSIEPLTEDDIRGLNVASSEEWCYSFYLWRSTKIEAPMQQWQEMLIAAATHQGVIARMAVGVVGEANKDLVIENIHGHLVVFLGEGTTPSIRLANEAITQLSEGKLNECTARFSNGRRSR